MGAEIAVLLIAAIAVLAYIVYQQEAEVKAARKNTQECLKIMNQIVDVLSADEEVINRHADVIKLIIDELIYKGLFDEKDLENISNNLSEVDDE